MMSVWEGCGEVILYFITNAVIDKRLPIPIVCFIKYEMRLTSSGFGVCNEQCSAVGWCRSPIGTKEFVEFCC